MNMLAAAVLQTPLPRTAWDMVVHATITTKIILAVLLVFSLASWILIIWKWIQFRRVRLLEEEFLTQVAQAQHLDDAYKAVIALAAFYAPGLAERALRPEDDHRQQNQYKS